MFYYSDLLNYINNKDVNIFIIDYFMFNQNTGLSLFKWNVRINNSLNKGDIVLIKINKDILSLEEDCIYGGGIIESIYDKNEDELGTVEAKLENIFKFSKYITLNNIDLIKVKFGKTYKYRKDEFIERISKNDFIKLIKKENVKYICKEEQNDELDTLNKNFDIKVNFDNYYQFEERNDNNELDMEIYSRILDYKSLQEKKICIGDLGEFIIFVQEIKYLIKNDRIDLAKKVIWVSKEIGDGLGYDILSYNIYGDIKYIEVKSTMGNIDNTIYLTDTELKLSKRKNENFYLYRVYNINSELKIASVKVYRGYTELNQEFEIDPKVYTVKFKSN